MYRPEMSLEAVLARDLRRVRAPDELWNRIENPNTKTHARMPVLQLLAAAALIAIVMWGLYPRPQAIHSSDAVQIHDFVKASAGLDVPLLAKLPAPLRLLGARVAHGHAEIMCRVGDRDVKLVVAKAGSATARGHREIKGRRTVSWAVRGQSYTLSCPTPEDLKMACFLCHSGGA